jgi:hypothetical protein
MLRRVSLVRTDVSEERRFLQEPHGVTSKKTPFFVVTAMKTSNLTNLFVHIPHINLFILNSLIFLKISQLNDVFYARPLKLDIRV